jgi:hypothetical protein
MPGYLQVLVARDRRLANQMVPTVRKIIHQDPEGLNKSIGMLWSGYRVSSMGWVELRSPNLCWMATYTAPTDAGVSQQVHLDLLEGRLLIDGNPLGRLPQEYTSHPVYARLFGQVRQEPRTVIE